jgi:hypothetical protein
VILHRQAIDETMLETPYPAGAFNGAAPFQASAIADDAAKDRAPPPPVAKTDVGDSYQQI